MDPTGTSAQKDGRGTAAEAAGRRAISTRSSEDVLLRAALRNKREIAVLVADLLLVVGAFVVAHYLRFETGLPEAHLDQMVTVLPLVVLVKIGTLYGFGAYRSLLRYAGSDELIRVAKASTVASGLLVVALVLAFRFEGFSRSVFIIDWLVATGSLAVVRGAFRGLRGYFAEKRRSGKRVLLYGAGDAGFLALREIRQNPELDLEPVGFVDDDLEKQGRMAHGLGVLGGGTELPDLCRSQEVDEVIITISDLSEELSRDVRRQCRQAGVGYREMRVGFVAVPESDGTSEVVRDETSRSAGSDIQS